MSITASRLKASILATVGFVGTLGVSCALAAQSPQKPLAASAIPMFAQPLPTLSVAGGTIAVAVGGDQTITMCPFNAKVLPPGTPLAANPEGTTKVWGYVLGLACPTNQDTYIGPVLVTTRGTPTQVTWVNKLSDTANATTPDFYKYSTDLTLHWADPLGTNPSLGGAPLPAESNACNMAGVPTFKSPCAQNYEGSIPAVPHLHGGEVPPVLDGGPDAWFTSDGKYKGHAYYSGTSDSGSNAAVYRYPNTQEAAPIWFHDHTLGATRLNVYAGLAGGYYIIDPSLTLPDGLDSVGLKRGNTVDYVVPLVIQDRMFDTAGQFFFPADSAGGVLWAVNPDHPYWVPEFVGDTIVVNGKAWPFFNVEPKRYRFLFLNGSNARTYDMWLENPKNNAKGPAMYVISSDGGYLDTPAKLDPTAGQTLLIQSGMRYEVIIDFSSIQPGTNLLLRNKGRTPYSKGPPPQGSSLGQIMQFRVGNCTSNQCGASDTSYNPATGPAIRSGEQKIVRLVNPATGTLATGVTVQKTRQLTLNEVLKPGGASTDPVTGVQITYPGGPLEILVNNTKWDAAVSEKPNEGATEIWEFINLTADAHPIHLHLVKFQVLNRQNFNTGNYNKAYAAAFPGGVFIPGYGPPLDYNTGNSKALGGNPDITPFLQGAARPPRSEEAGWKDTVMALPAQVTRIVVRWAPTSLAASTPASSAAFPFDPSAGGGHGYVWHCHIIDHEDNEMMRPDVVNPNPNTTRRTYNIGADY